MHKQSQHHNTRSASHGRKLPSHSRPAVRPALTRNRSSYHVHAHSASVGNTRSAKPSSTTSTSSASGGTDTDDHDSTMESFLQFCATCERQIVTPGNTILYCSESCRRKDVSNPKAWSDPSISPLMTPTCPFDDTPREDIVPPRSPTIVRPLSSNFSDLNLTGLGSPVRDYASAFGRRDSHMTMHSEKWGERERNLSNAHRQSVALDHSNLPSLSHTPSSSVGTAASVRSSRPVPRRSHPSHSSSTSRHGVDLVNPFTAAATSPTHAPKESSLKSSASTLTTYQTAEANTLTYTSQRPSISRRDSQAQGSLKQVYCKSPPSNQRH